MKKFLELSSWSRKAAIGSMLIMAFAFVGCDDSSSASAGPNDEPGVESSSSVVLGSSSSEKKKSQSSSSEKSGKSSSSANDVSSSSEKLPVTSSSSAGKAKSSSSSVALATPCKTETEDNCEYGTLLDERDGQEYKTVKIGDQWWMAENLNYETENSYCYDDDPSNCSKYGRLYTWAAAKTVCPSGWHLPSTTEWKTLFTAVGGSSTAGTVLKSTGGWYNDGNGTDAFGFSALPAGYRYSNGYYDDEGDDALFWSSTESTSGYAYDMYLYYYSDGASLYYDDKYYGFSVRCVKD